MAKRMTKKETEKWMSRVAAADEAGAAVIAARVFWSQKPFGGTGQMLRLLVASNNKRHGSSVEHTYVTVDIPCRCTAAGPSLASVLVDFLQDWTG